MVRYHVQWWYLTVWVDVADFASAGEANDHLAAVKSATPWVVYRIVWRRALKPTQKSAIIGPL